MKSKKEHNNKSVYTYTYINSKANSERTLQSICNVIFKIIKYYFFYYISYDHTLKYSFQLYVDFVSLSNFIRPRTFSKHLPLESQANAY